MPLKAADLTDPRRVQSRFLELVAKGAVEDCERDRLAYFAMSRYCSREGRSPAGLLNRLLRSADRWRDKPAQCDEDWARSAIGELDNWRTQPAEPDDRDDTPCSLGDLLAR